MTEETLFHEALARPPAERAAFLGQACAGQPQLRAAVEALLAAHKASGSFLNQPPVHRGQTVASEPGEAPHGVTGEFTPQPEDSQPKPALTTDYRPQIAPGLVIAGRYTLQEKIGEGGMGEVWVAKQTVPVKRKVALKLIKTGMDSRAVVARFEQERQALALMDHPNIARVLDGGIDIISEPRPLGSESSSPLPNRRGSERPFFVMELVNGLPLTRFCDEARLTPRQRLELFVPICQAVQHAHQKGIVHRDLKPANILVTLIDGKPIPKVIDFGVAKATGGKLTDESLSTQFGAVVGTLEYMAPEQAGYAGIDIDTRADIYSLGVILYELLTGLRPIDARRLKQAALAEMIRIIQEEEPSKPSTRLSTDESLPSLAALRQTAPRQLMALLRGELDCVVMKCLEKQRDRRYETANGLARDIQRYLADEPVEARPASAGYRLGKFLKRHKGPVVAAGLVLLALVAGITGTTFGLIRAEKARTAETERAEGERLAKLDAEARRSEAEAQKVRAETGEQLAGARLVQVETEKRKVEEEKRIAQAVRDFLQHKLLGQADSRTQADTLLRAGGLAAEAKENPTIRELLDRAAKELAEDRIEANFPQQSLLQAEILRTVGDTYGGIGEYERAISFLQRSAATLKKLHVEADHPNTLSTLNNLAGAYRDAGKLNEAIALFEQVRDVEVKKLGADHPETLFTLNNLAQTYDHAGRGKQAIELYEQIRPTFVKKLGADHRETLNLLNNLAAAYWDAGRRKEASALFAQVCDAYGKILGAGHPSTLSTRYNLARTYRDTGKRDEAIALFGQVRDAQVNTLGADHPSTLATLISLAGAYQDAGKLSEAIELLKQTCTTCVTKLGPDHPYTLTARNDLAVAYQDAGMLDEAIELYGQVRIAQLKHLGADHPETLNTLSNLAGANRDAGKLEVAIELFKQVRDARVKQLGADHPDTLNTLNYLAAAYWSADQFNRSVPLFEDVLRRRQAILGRQHPDTQMTVANLGVNYKDTGRLTEAIPLLEEAYRASRASPTLRWVGVELLDAYAKAGQSAEAAKLVQELLAGTRTDLPGDSPQLAGNLASCGLALLQLKAYADAEPILRECLTIREKTQPDRWTTFNTQSLLGGALLGQKKYAEAEPHLLKGYEGMKEREKTIPPPGKIRLPEAIDRLVQLYEATDRKDEAAKWRKEKEQLPKEQTPTPQAENKPDKPVPIDPEKNDNFKSAEARLAEGKVPEAIKLFEQVHKERTARLGSDHPETLSALHGLGRACLAYGEGNTAIRLLEEAVQKMRVCLGEDHPESCDAIASLARAYRSVGKSTEAIALFEQALDVAHRTFPERSSTLIVMNDLARCYLDAGKPEHAAPLLKMVLDRKQKQIASMSNLALIESELTSVADLKCLLGECLLQQNKPAEAEPMLRDVLAQREKKEKDTWTLFQAQSLLGGALLGQKKYAEAEPMLLAGYEGLKRHAARIAPPGKARLIEAVQRLMQLYEAVEKKDEVARWRSELRSIRAAQKQPEKQP